MNGPSEEGYRRCRGRSSPQMTQNFIFFSVDQMEAAVFSASLSYTDDRAQELCESRGGRPGLPVSNKPTVSVDVKQHVNQLHHPSSGAV